MADVINKFLVGDQGGKVMILNLPLQARPTAPGQFEWPHVGPLERDEALNLAAWLVAITAVDRAEFLRLLDAVEAT